MKRLFLLLALGAIFMVSCVDDKESSGVEALRKAKVEWYKAQSELLAAQAEYQLALAEGELAKAQEAKVRADSLKAVMEQMIQKNKDEKVQQLMTEFTTLSSSVNTLKNSIAKNENVLANNELALQDEVEYIQQAYEEVAMECQYYLDLYNTCTKALQAPQTIVVSLDAQITELELQQPPIATAISMLQDSVLIYDVPKNKYQDTIDMLDPVADAEKIAELEGKIAELDEIQQVYLAKVDLLVAKLAEIEVLMNDLQMRIMGILYFDDYYAAIVDMRADAKGKLMEEEAYYNPRGQNYPLCTRLEFLTECEKYLDELKNDPDCVVSSEVANSLLAAKIQNDKDQLAIYVARLAAVKAELDELLD